MSIDRRGICPKNSGYGHAFNRPNGACQWCGKIEQEFIAEQTNSHTFQERVAPWMQECFGPDISADTVERNHRFLEESLELVQSCGCTQEEAHQLVDYVFGRPVGDPPQEVGGVMVTLAALCIPHGMDMHDAGEVELTRISAPDVIEKIRRKQATKPKHSPLPESFEIPDFLRRQPTGGMVPKPKPWPDAPPASAWLDPPIVFVPVPEGEYLALIAERDGLKAALAMQRGS